MILSVCLAVLGLQGFVAAEATVVAPDRVYVAVITGMTCKGCAREVNDFLVKVEGVKAVDVDYKATKATITMKGETALTKAAVDKALEGSKFKATSLEEQKAPESRPPQR
jgi:copper chaperone CopZ